MLDSDTSYFVVMQNANTANTSAARYGVSTTLEDGEDSGALVGWTIADTARVKNNSGAWSAFASRVFRIQLRGSAIDPPSDDATLGALALADASDDSAITLAPTFAAGTVEYAAAVGNAVDTVTLMATPTDGNATVSAVTLGGAAIADGDFSDGITVPSLLVDDNTIVVTVTAQDTTTELDYTVTVTRRAPLLTPPADAVWSAVLTPVVVAGNVVVGCSNMVTDQSQWCAFPHVLTEDSFPYEDRLVDYTITALHTYADGANIGRLDFSVNDILPGTVDLILVVDGVEYPFTGADHVGGASRQWPNTGLDQTWRAGVPVAVWLVEPPLRRRHPGRADRQ